jgi:hypothetical protein
MAKDIMSQGAKGQPQRASAECGGVLPGYTTDVNSYKPPQGPKNIMDPKSAGLHGKNHGTMNGPDNGGRHSGSPGIGGMVHGCGSQGRHK